MLPLHKTVWVLGTLLAVLVLCPIPSAWGFTYALSSFSLDMTKGTLTLEFPVSMQSATLNATAIVLQSATTVRVIGSWLRLTGDLNTEVYNSSSIEIFLRNSDYYALQLDSQLAKSLDTTYLRLDSHLITSVNMVGVTPIANGAAMRASTYVPDRLPPFLLAFSLDMNTGALNLTFNEPVDLTSFRASAITLQQQQDKIYDERWEQYRLKDWNHYTLVDERINVTGITRYHYSYSYSIGINQTYPYDYTGLLPGMAHNFTVTWDGHNYTYRHDPNVSYWIDYDQYQGYGFTVHTNMGLINLNGLKAKAPLAVSADTVFLAAYRPIVRDIAGNNMSTATVQDYLALPVSTYVADTTRPELQGFVLDLNEGLLQLSFSETVNTAKLNLSHVCLQKTANWSAPYHTGNGAAYCLQPGVSFTNQSATAQVVVELGEHDLNGIKMVTKLGLCTSVSTSFLSFPKTLAVDMAWIENVLVPVPRSAALQAWRVVQDVSSPALKYFDLDWDRRLLTLVFNEAIQASSVAISDITLQQSVNPGRSGSKYSLTSASNVTSPDGPVLTVYVGFADYAAIKMLPNLCSLPTNTFLSFPRTMLTDLSQSSPNYVVAVSPSKALPVKKYTYDTSPPYLRGFTLDLDANTLTLVFSEPVQARSLNATGIVLFASASGEQPYRLMDSAASFNASDAMELLVYMGSNDIRRIKVNTHLCRSKQSCFASIDAKCVRDTNDPIKSNANIEQPRPVQATGYIADNNAVQLSSFELDMTGGGLLLVFDKPVLASSLNCSALTFFSSTASGAESVALLEPCINPNADGDRLQLTLWPSDVARIKASRSVCLSGEATWLSLASWLVQDMFGNPAAALNRSQALPVSGFTPDVTGPVLLSWDLYKDQRRLRLHFDEPVNVSTLEVGGVTLQGFSTRLNLPFYTLTPASSSGAYNDTEGGGEKSVVDVSFGSTDAAQVHARRARMGSTQANSYLLLSKLTIRDMAGNRNQAILDGSGLQLGPVLRFFFLDMDAGLLTLVFSRAVDTDYLEQSGLTLLSAEDEQAASSTYTLTGSGDGGHVSSVLGGLGVRVWLTDDDLSRIKTFGDLCVSAASTFLAVDPSAIIDTDPSPTTCCGMNSVVEVLASSAMQAAWYTADATAPKLSSWDLNLNTGLMTLYFDEPINRDSIDLSAFSLIIPADTTANSTTSPSSSIVLSTQLSGASTVTSGNSSTQTVAVQTGSGLGMELDAVKRMLARVSRTRHSHLSLVVGQGAARDMSPAGNSLVAINSSSPLRVSRLTSDVSAPTLLYFDLDMTRMELTLVFDEAVNLTTFDASVLALHPALDSPTTLWQNFSACSTVQSNGSAAAASVVISICESDMNQLKAAYPLVSSVDYVFLTAKAGLCWDIAQPPSDFAGGGPLQVNTYIQDYVPPSVVSFDLDMDTGAMSVTLDEPVWPQRTDVSGLTLQRYNFTGDEYDWWHTLRPGVTEVTGSQIGTTVSLTIGKDDLDLIKMKDGVALTGCSPLSGCSTYLRVDMRAFTDLAGNAVLDIFDGKAIPVSSFSPDVTPPELHAFSLYHDARLVLYFSEPIQVDSIDVTGIQMANRFGNVTMNLTRLSRVEATDNSLVVPIDLSGDWSLNTVMGWGTPHSDMSQLARRGIGLRQLHTYLTAAAYTCKDVAGTPLLPIFPQHKLQMGPVVMSFVLDMNAGYLNLTFNLPVFGGSLVKPQALALQGSQASSTRQSRLTSCSSASSGNVSAISITICKSDLDLIKGQRSLALAGNSTYLTVESSPVLTRSISTRPIDFYVAVGAIQPSHALKASKLIADTTRPTLDSYTINLNTDTLDLYFSEPVVLGTLAPSGLTLYGSMTLEPYCVLSTSPSSSSYTAGHVSLSLNEEDKVCVAVYGTGKLLTMTADTGTDYASNPLVDISPVTPLEASTYVSDSVAPAMANATLNLTSGYLQLTFTEVVDPDSLDSSQLSLVYYPSTPSGSPAVLNLTSEAVTFSQAASTLSLELSFVFSLLASLQGMAHTAYQSSGLSVGFQLSRLKLHAQTGLISDFADNQLKNASLGVTWVYADTSRPSLLSFHLSVSSSSLTLYFDEAVDPSSFDPTKVSVQSSASSASSTPLTSGTSAASSSTASRTLSVTLSSADQSSLQSATSQSNTYLSLTSSGAVSDYTPSSNPSLPTSTALQQGPRVHRAALDMDKARLLLVFSHPVTFSSIDPTALLLVGNVSTNTLRVFNSSVSNLDSSSSTLYVRVSFGSLFLDALKVREGLAKTANATSLSVESGLGQDSHGNTIVPIAASAGLKLHSFKRDTGHPMVERVALDMNQAVLNLTFNEPVALALTAVQFITLQSQRVFYANSTYQVSFSSMGRSSIRNIADKYSSTIVVAIGDTEMAQLKHSRAIARSRSTTFFTSVRDCFFDTAQPPNTAWSILRSNSHRLDLLVTDKSRPKLLFFALDMNAGVLMLSFDEPVDLASFNSSGLQIMQYAYSGYGGHHRLKNYSAIAETDFGRKVLVTLSEHDWAELNADSNVAHIIDQTFLTMDNHTVADTSGNLVKPVVDGEAMLAAFFTHDTTPPRLLNYTLNMDTGILRLSFSEMVLGSSFDASGLVLESLNRSCFYYNRQGRTFSSCSADEWAAYRSVTLSPTRTRYSGADSSTLDIKLSEYDVNAIKSTPLLCKSPDSTYLAVLPSAATDMSGNRVLQIGGLPESYDPAVVSRGMKAGLYHPDVTSGNLRSFNLDMNRGLLTLNFSEPMVMTSRPGSVDVRGINLHSTPIVSESRAYSLTGASSISNRSPRGLSNVIYLYLTTEDLNMLKVLGIGRQDVVRSNGYGLDDSVWLTLALGSFHDAMGLPVQPVLDKDVQAAHVLKVMNLTVDTKPPELSRMLVQRGEHDVPGDESGGHRLYLQFDEAVDKEASFKPSALQLLVYLGPSTVRMRLSAAKQVPWPSSSMVVLDMDAKPSGGGSSDWERLVSLTGGASEVLDLYVSAEAWAVTDLSLQQNELKPISMYMPLRQSRTVCTCPDGSFAASPCSTTTDAVCRPCSACSSGSFELRPCTTIADRQCGPCTECRYPYFMSQPCRGTNDTTCTYCSECGPDEYVTEECSSTADRKCGSCRSCKYLSAVQAEGCLHVSQEWREENCCRDSRGQHVECTELSYAEFGISTVSGKRHWVFKKTVPKVAGRTQWTGNFYDWYQATKSESGYA